MADDELAAIRAARLKELQQQQQQQQPHAAQVTAHTVCRLCC
jgi:DNA-binding TFAR19-related protein (PDSD5 family)